MSAMSVTPVYPLWRGSCRILICSSAVMAAAAAAVLALGVQDPRLLRLGLLAALWAALLGAFAAAQCRREARSCADHVDHLRSTYQLELEREVSARREHTLTVERELREQAECSQRREIVELRAEIAAMRANLELLGDSRPAVPALPVGRGHTDSASRFGPDPQPSTGPLALPTVDTGTARRQGRHGAPAWRVEQSQRTVEDLIAAHGATTASYLRRNRQDDAATTA